MSALKGDREEASPSNEESFFSGIAGRLKPKPTQEPGATIYKWTDETGKVHFSHAKPEDIATTTEINIKPEDINSSKPPPDIPTFSKDKPFSPPTNISFKDVIPTPKNVEKLVDDAVKVRDIMEQRNETLKQIVE